MAPANNPFGAPSSLANANPFAQAGGRSPSPFGQQSSAFGTPSQDGVAMAKGVGLPNSRPGLAGNSLKRPQTPVPTSDGSRGSGQKQLPQNEASQKPFGGNGSRQQPSFGAPAQPTALTNGNQASASRFGAPPVVGTPTAPSDSSAAKASPLVDPINKNLKKDASRSSSAKGKKLESNLANGKNATATQKYQAGPKRRDEQADGRARSGFNGSGKNGLLRLPTERTRQMSEFAFQYANKLYDQLRKESLKPPQWPPEPGNPSKRGAVEALKDAYKKYRARVYAALQKVDLIDDPEKRRKLEDALPFKGICEDMCPEFEQISRIAEFDVMAEEKEVQADGVTMWAEPSRMVKKFGRSAAGQDAPLPMDVRSVDALRRTTDYLFDDLLQSDSNLSSMHNFLWDRTRAVRRDFTFHSQKSKEEMRDMVYCFETIARFHAIALHLLSRKGVAAADFDQKQEIDQLGRTILSLMQAYDNCHDYNVPCENEAEFRAYWLLLNAHDPSIMSRIPSWGKEAWFESDEVQTALALVQSMVDLKDRWGPIKPRRPHTVSASAFMNYFTIVEDPSVSYTMACMAEVHFTFVRQRVLKNLVKGYARYRDAPRYITAAEVNSMLRFDTDEEAAEFVKAHGFEFSTWVPEGRAAVAEPYLLLNDRKKRLRWPRVQQSFSRKLVERKRTTESLSYVIHNTIYEQPSAAVGPVKTPGSPDGLFVTPREEPVEAAHRSLSPLADVTEEAGTSPGFPTQISTQIPAQGAVSANTALGLPTGILPSGSSNSTTPAASSNHFAGFDQTAQPSLAVNGSASNLSTIAKAAEAPSPFAFSNQANGQPGSQPFSAPQNIANPISSAAFFSGLGENKSETKKRFSFSPAPPLETNAAPSTSPGSASNGPSAGLGSESAKTNAVSRPVSFARFAKQSDKGSETTTSILPQPKTSVFPSSGQPLPSATFFPTNATTTPSLPRNTLCPSNIGAPSATSTTSGAQPVLASPSQPTPTWPASDTSSGIPRPLQAEQSVASTSLTPQYAPARQVPVDGLGNFTKWYVLGDDGLMAQFIDFMVQSLAQEVFDQVQREGEERRLREEEERSRREARDFQVYNLRVKFFYRWRENARALAVRRVLREGKEKMRAYREKERAVQKKRKVAAAEAQREAENDARRRAQADGHHLTQLARSGMERRASAEAQLLASGIFSGLRDERGAAHRAVNDVAEADNFARPTRPRSFVDAARASTSSRLSLVSHTRSPSVSSDINTGKEGWKTRSLREKYGLEARINARRSFSPGSSIIYTTNASGSPPDAWARTTNFSSRKRSADGSTDDERSPKRPAAKGKLATTFRSRHWELRARGFVPMPDGHWLPEAIAKPMLEEGKRYANIGDCGLGPGDSTSAPMSDNELEDVSRGGDRSSVLLRKKLRELGRSTPGDAGYEATSGKEKSSSPPSSGRKRSADDDDDGALDGSPMSAERRTSFTQPDTDAIVADTKRMLRELRNDLDRLDAEERPWMREQLERSERGQSSWG